jgi:hypothetical protein
LFASIPQLYEPDGVLTISTSFVITVINDCSTSNLIDQLLPNLTTDVAVSLSSSISFEDLVSQGYGIPGYCGPQVVTFSGGLPMYLQLDQEMRTLTLYTTNVLDVGTHNLQMNVGLANYPTVPSLTKNFVVTITCQVF